MHPDKRFVYVLRSNHNPRRQYVGLTSDVASRLEWHNAGQNEHTIRDRPWHVIVSVEFATAEGRTIRTLPEDRLWPRVREAPFPLRCHPHSTRRRRSAKS